MGETTGIEWTDHTFNAWIGCTKVSDGCRNCYAERQNGFRKWNGGAWGPSALRKVTSAANWKEPLKWAKAARTAGVRERVFLNSLADTFDTEAPVQARRDLWLLIGDTFDVLDWQILTKRPERITEVMCDDGLNLGFFEACKCWLGTTAENQAAAAARIPALLQIDAAVHFASCEPILGELDLSRWLEPIGVECIDVCPSLRYIRKGEVETFTDPNRNEVYPLCPNCGLVAHWTGYDEGIDWVICGGESRPKARPMHLDWARSLRDQCAGASVPFFFKQWGEWLPGLQYEDIHCAADPDETQSKFPCMDWDDEVGKWFNTGGGWDDDLGENAVFRVGKKLAGALLDGVEHRQFPAVR